MAGRRAAVRDALGTFLRTWLLPAACVAALAPSALGASTFQGFGILPGDTGSGVRGLSADGSVAVGASGNHAVRWTAAGGLVDLGAGTTQGSAAAVSADGSVVVGTSIGPGGFGRAFRWTAATGMVDLGNLPGSVAVGATGVSADGSTAIGTSQVNGAVGFAFRWTAATGLISLGTLPGGTASSAAAVSADGSVVVGISNSGAGPGHLHAYRWTAATGMVDLGALAGDVQASATGVSADGSVVVGMSGSANQGNLHAFRWTAATGMVNLGALPAGGVVDNVFVSADGSTVVGTSATQMIHAFRWTAVTGVVDLGVAPGGVQADALGVSADGSAVIATSAGTPNQASAWTAATGMESIQAALTQGGVNLSGWTLTFGTNVSADGSTFAGSGTDPNGATQGWIASLGTAGSSCNPLPATTVLAAAILPDSRSVMVPTTATVLATILNGGLTTACQTGITLATAGIPAAVTYNQTNCATNAVTGGTNVPVDIPPGGAACYVIALTPSAPFGPVDLEFGYGGGNTLPVAPIVGVNTLLMSASATPVPDVVALAATTTNNGIADIPGSTGTGFFVVATVNLGLGASITVTTDTGGTVLPITVLVCQTDALGACIGLPTPTVTLQINTSDTPTFAVFVTGSAFVPFDPANNRVFVRFKDAGGVTRGATSVAVQTL